MRESAQRSEREPPRRRLVTPASGGGPADPVSAGEHRVPGDDAAALRLLANGSLDVQGRLVVASNATLYCTVSDAGSQAACVYKPVAGERPLWDFPVGTLAGREVAAYAVSAAAGWHLVPPTVFRDGPFGPGMCQLWIESDETVDVIALSRSKDNTALRQMAVFDAVGWPAAPGGGATDGHRGFAAGEQHGGRGQRLAVQGDAMGDAGEQDAGMGGLALQRIAEDER